jgi:glycosyltransferase involved in cell wall biosynthesis
LLLIGQVAPKDVEKLARSLDELTRHTALQIILHDAFTPEAEVPIYFQMVDFVLAPYQGHIGSSGILLWAAAAGKPVLAPTYGLMGELVRRHQLGLAVDTTQPQALAQGCMTFLTNDAATGFNQAAAAQFARSHSAEQFAQALVQHLRLQEGNLCSTG